MSQPEDDAYVPGHRVTQAGNPAPGDVGNPVDEEVTQSRTTSTKATKLRVTDINRLLDLAEVTDESPASILTRVLNERARSQDSIANLVIDNEHLTKVNTELRETLVEEQNRYLAKFDEYVEAIGQLQAQITTLESSARTAVVPADGQTGMEELGIKDVIEEAKDVCGDDETCAKVMGKMIDLRAHFASKAVDNEHNANQNRLDREQKELDRKSKEDQAEKDRKFKEDQAARERASRIELALAKKGGFKKEFLDDVVFLGGGTPKRPSKEIEMRKKEAMAAAEDEDDWSDPTAEEELMMMDDSEEVL